MVRGKISAGAPTRELYAAQHASQKAAAAIPAVPVIPQVPPATMPAPPAPPIAAPEPTIAPVSPPQPTQPEVLEAISAPPVTHAVPVPPVDEAQHPSFKEPPPEDEDLLPRPTFKEPPPEDDYVPPPMPTFAEPPVSPPATPPPPQPDVVPSAPQSKPTPVPVKRDSLINRSNSPSPATAFLRSRSPSPSDETLTPQASLSRSGSAQSGYVRGPRTSRGPRAPGGNVSSMVSSMNRSSMGGPPSSAPSYKRLSGSPSRPQSMVGTVAQDSRARGIGRTQALSRRTMASDAEDDVVQ